jgi:hypothetical protein
MNPGNFITSTQKKQNEEDDILNFLFDDDLLKVIYLNRCKDSNEKLSIDGGKIFLSEFNSRNGEEFSSSHDPFIERLDVSGMKIGLNTIFALTKFVKKTKPVHNLNISNNMIKDYGVYNLKEFFKNSMLKSVNLSSNMITSVGLVHVTETLIKLSSLKYLNLGVCKNSFAKNNLGVEGARALKELLISSPSLETLILEENNIGKEGVAFIAEGLSCSKLIELTIRHNDVSSKGLAKILANGTKLTKLNVADNKISNSSAIELSRFLVQKNVLQTLVLSNNKLNFDAINDLITYIKPESPLKDLRIANCNLSGIDISVLSSLLTSKGLYVLDLSSTQLTPWAIYTLFSNLPSSSLERINLSHNVINHNVFEKRVFPQGIPHLQKISLCNCGLDDNTLVHFLHYAKRFHNLSEIEVVNNLLTEEVVPQVLQVLGDFKNLHKIGLDQNRINLQQRKEISDRLNTNKKNILDKAPKIMQRTFHRLIYEKENIEKLGENIKTIEEKISKLQEQKKTAEIEFVNDHQNIVNNQKQIREKIEKNIKIFDTRQKNLKEKEAEFSHLKIEMQTELAKLTEVLIRNQAQNTKLKNEQIHVDETKQDAEEKFEVEYFKKMNIVSELMSETSNLKASSDFYLARINEHMNLQRMDN